MTVYGVLIWLTRSIVPEEFREVRAMIRREDQRLQSREGRTREPAPPDALESP